MYKRDTAADTMSFAMKRSATDVDNDDDDENDGNDSNNNRAAANPQKKLKSSSRSQLKDLLSIYSCRRPESHSSHFAINRL